jgi:hypothetical protein
MASRRRPDRLRDHRRTRCGKKKTLGLARESWNGEAVDVGAPRWRKLIVDGRYNADVRALAQKSGAYAIRHKPTGETLYVGHSHTGRTWKTLLRHLQGQDSFERVGDWVYRGSQSDLEVSIWPTRADQAQLVEGELVDRLEPKFNLDRPEDHGDDEVPF